MSLKDPAHIHALRYATEATKVFLMDKYRQDFPHFFQDAILETRAATSEDYYVPPSLASKAVVVVRMAFDEIGCRRFSCFPYTYDWEPCSENPQWLAVGRHFEMACQHSCQDHAVNTDWVKERCILANPLKKLFAIRPEKAFEQGSRQVYHGGLDVVDGTLALNPQYCEAYGLQWVEGDCDVPGFQKFGEWILGKTPIRAAATAHLRPYVPPASPPLPPYMVYPHPKKRLKRAPNLVWDETFIQEIAFEIVQEVGEEVTEWGVKNYLSSKAPRLLSLVLDRVAMKLVIKHSILAAVRQLGMATLKGLAKSATVVGAVYTVYEVIVGIMDKIDPLDFNKRLKKEDVRQVDEQLDDTYFQDSTLRPEMTPEYVWTHQLLGEDASESMAFMVERVTEYLMALKATPAAAAAAAPLKLFEWQKPKEDDKHMFFSLTFVALCVAILYVEYIHVWASVLFFLKIYFRF